MLQPRQDGLRARAAWLRGEVEVSVRVKTRSAPATSATSASAPRRRDGGPHGHPHHGPGGLRGPVQGDHLATGPGSPHARGPDIAGAGASETEKCPLLVHDLLSQLWIFTQTCTFLDTGCLSLPSPWPFPEGYISYDLHIYRNKSYRLIVALVISCRLSLTDCHRVLVEDDRSLDPMEVL